jgi:hypothetical protein
LQEIILKVIYVNQYSFIKGRIIPDSLALVALGAKYFKLRLPAIIRRPFIVDMGSQRNLLNQVSKGFGVPISAHSNVDDHLVVLVL